MIVFRQINNLQTHLHYQRAARKRTGFVPTMGALHKGHVSLITKAKADCDSVICSIFVNPAQFNDINDFEKYPHTAENDIYLLEKAGCDILFMPAVQEIYPEGLDQAKSYDLGYLETVLEGAYRPGHFQGVCRVMEKLLAIFHPDKLFLGQKDYQQCMVIKKLSELMNINTEIVVCPTVREEDGLAMSSRNLRLDEAQRKKAPLIYDTLCFIQQNIRRGDLNGLKQKAADYLTGEGFKVDYIEIADAASIVPEELWNGKTPLVALAAAFIGGVRLIDNLLL